MKLTRFKVTNFRSVEDSGWIEVDRVAALIGVNESGKTNLLLPLWKLHPAREGEIQPTADYPKKLFGQIRENPGQYCFITAEFETEDAAAVLAEQAGVSLTEAGRVIVKRWFDGNYTVSFPSYECRSNITRSEFQEELTKLADALNAAPALTKEEGLKSKILIEVSDALATEGDLTSAALTNTIRSFQKSLPEQGQKTSTIVPLTRQIIEKLEQWHEEISAPEPEERDGVFDLVMELLPTFVYYSNYGNLDSEIYLPHVVQNLDRSDLGAKEAAKSRTLRVLFSFVKLKPQEILELGRDFKERGHNREPTPDEIAQIAEKKKERSILLQSASSQLTSRFKEWWKQGNYRFRFEADGNHFRIWVADEQRPEEVELENRSTGLQWFLSFYLVFLVESLGEHKDAILLLDEPGLSLHPLAQRNLSAFFDGLADTNQLIYTTHSPFLVDADRLDRARKVYVSQNGTTKATEDLRYAEGEQKQQAGAAYAVYSALNLNVAESLLLGCQPILVEGATDQHYLTAIKALLIAGNKVSPPRELVFPPSGGTKTARIVASILTGRDERLPAVLLDGDESGRRMTTELRSGLYADAKQLVLNTDEFVGFDRSEVEDLFPCLFVAEVLDRLERGADVPFAEVVRPGLPIVPQIEQWARNQAITLSDHWKVELAKRVKHRALSRGVKEFDDEVVERWVKLFKALIAA